MCGGDNSACVQDCLGEWGGMKQLDDYGFVIDFSSLKFFEQKLRNQFDHTFLVNADDPLLDEWMQLDKKGALDLRVMENVGMEATAVPHSLQSRFLD